MQSALTGHLVLSSLHATDATAALHRFLDMGIESFLVASSVIGVVAQRLVRRICVACREPYEPTADELALYEQWGGKPKDVFTHGAGCNFCAQTGYVGAHRRLRAAARHASRSRSSSSGGRRSKSSGRWRSSRACARCAKRHSRIIEEDVTTIAEVLRSIYIV